jgi:hypothetical protein
MILSRHAQVENLTQLLGLRRSEVRQRTLRQAAYWNLVGAILERPAAEITLASPLSSVDANIATLPNLSQAA